MMDLEEMTIEQLVALREQIQRKMDQLREEYVAAGKILDLKVQVQRLPSEDEIAAKEAEVARLREIKVKLNTAKLGGK